MVFEGWMPFAALLMNEDYFLNRKRVIYLAGNSQLKEERGIYGGFSPCIVIYKK